jgi:hypothetical protein
MSTATCGFEASALISTIPSPPFEASKRTRAFCSSVSACRIGLSTWGSRPRNRW